MIPSHPVPDALSQEPALLRAMRRGIEKEGLRVDESGMLALTPHPEILGSALTNPHITTDYSEALLELITGTHDSTETLLGELREIHQFVAQSLDHELIWNQSMPSHLPPEADIPVGWYGHSNTGMLKHVYRLGLAERYGKTMQCIAGLHYNFSVPDALWDALGIRGMDAQDQRSRGYMALIRNFTRCAWLLMVLFGATPALSREFLQGRPHQLQPLTDDTLYLPYATSLRMSDLGYQNRAPSELQLCYNDLDTFVARMYSAVTTPWPAYEAIGTKRDGKWIQLNTNILQIENEYYSNIRPKRTTGRCERPATALSERGVEYVEVRCLDIDPDDPLGISPDTARFMDVFLLFCAAERSDYFPGDGFCTFSQANFSAVVKEGRKPGLQLKDRGVQRPLHEWALEIIGRMQPYAQLLDQALGGDGYAATLHHQREKILDMAKTPSARLLHALKESGLGLHQYTLEQSKRHWKALREETLSPEMRKRYESAAASSIQEQADIEASDTISFDDYVARYHAALNYPTDR